jgi:hypothetical protein
LPNRREYIHPREPITMGTLACRNLPWSEEGACAASRRPSATRSPTSTPVATCICCIGPSHKPSGGAHDADLSVQQQLANGSGCRSLHGQGRGRARGSQARRWRPTAGGPRGGGHGGKQAGRMLLDVMLATYFFFDVQKL